MKNWGLHPSDVEDRLRLVAPVSFEEACTWIYRLYAEAAGCSNPYAIGDKNPVHSLFCDSLTGMFPGARFILLTRDPRANVASYRRVPFDLNDVASLAWRWNHYNQAVLESLSGLDVLHVLRFEDLVTDPESTLRSACAFLGVGYEPGMLSASAERAPTHVAWHARLDGPLDAGRLDAWREELSADEMRTIEAVCGETAARLGYELPQHPDHIRGTRTQRMAAALRTEAERHYFTLPLWLRSRLDRLRRAMIGLD